MPILGSSSKVNKLIQEAKERNDPELHLVERGITSLVEVPQLMNLTGLTRLSLAHNKLQALPPSITDLSNLQFLSTFNNDISELPQNMHKLANLHTLNLGMNRLVTLPKNFQFSSLQVLDISYNNLSDNFVPESLYHNRQLRALYFSDNDLEVLPEAIAGLASTLEILTLRGNDIYQLPESIGQLRRLRELNLSCNRLIVLPPQFGQLKQFKETSREGPDYLLDLDNNHLVQPLKTAFADGNSVLLGYVQNNNYVQLYNKHLSVHSNPPEKADKSKKKSRRPMKK